jgi:hypothetical protein
MTRITIAVLIFLAVIAAVWAAPRMQRCGFVEYLHAKCDNPAQPPECRPRGGAPALSQSAAYITG